MRTPNEAIDEWLERGNFELRLLSVLFALCLILFGALFTVGYLVTEPTPPLWVPITQILSTSVGITGMNAIFTYRAKRRNR